MTGARAVTKSGAAPPAPLLTHQPPPPVGIETQASAMAAQAQAQVVARYQMAIQRPRHWPEVERALLEVCGLPEFAEAALYSVPRGSKTIVDFSIRFAEEAVRLMGNIHADAVVTFEDETDRFYRCTVTDLEANVTYPYDVVVHKTVERRDPSGREVVSSRKNREGQDVYRVAATPEELLEKQGNLVSKAIRSGIMRLMPFALRVKCKAALEAAVGKAGEKPGNKEKMVARFASYGVTPDHIAAFLGHPVADMTLAEYSELRAIGISMAEDSLTWDEVMAQRGQPIVGTTTGETPPPPEAPPTTDPAGEVSEEEKSRLFDLEMAERERRRGGYGE